jgi:anti-sigma factor ChrR (cupin superfamily)
MPQKHTDEDIQELAASYALGILSDEEKAEFEAMLKGDGPASAYLQYFNEIVGDMTYNTEPLAEPKGLEERLFAQIEEQSEDSNKDSGFLYVRESQGEWAEVVAGVRVKQLYEDPNRKYSTVLVRMDPGATFPDHVHAEAEECYIIEGDIHMGGHKFGVGDYIRADAHSVHEAISSENGCLLLVMASQENQILA